MGKYIKITIILLLILLFAHFFTGIEKKEKTEISEDKFMIEKFYVNKLINNGEGYYKISADTADYDRNADIVHLDLCRLEYNTKGSILNVGADECIYELDKQLTLRKNINGSYNDITFDAPGNASFEYDLIDGKGHLLSGVKITRNEDTICAEILKFKRANKVLFFEKNVKVIYKY